MDTLKAERLAELFEFALGLPAADRSRYAADACSDDPELRTELSSLLAAYEEAPDCLDRIAARGLSAALTRTHSFGPLQGFERGRSDLAGLAPGQRFGRYAILRLLGTGGMSEVWEAEDLDNQRRVALKAMHWTLRGPDDRARFLSEGRLAASVSHPNVIYVFGTEEIDGVPVISMEVAAGGTLKDLVAAGAPIPPTRAVDIIRQLIAGLEAIAAAGVLHRDIKPSNCFVDADGRIKIGDFGIAAATAVDRDRHSMGAGLIVGTPAFASPEQLEGAPLDVRSDIYAVGATLYTLLTGHPPLPGSDVDVVTRAIRDTPAPARIHRNIPRKLDGVVRRCLSKEPKRRPQSYEQLRRLLVPYGSTAPTAANLPIRLLAGLGDWLVLMMLFQPVGLILLALGYQRMPSTRLEMLHWWFAGMGASGLYFGLPEGFWGASPAKMIARLRLVTLDGQPVRLGRALVRAELHFLLMSFPGLLAVVIVGPELVALDTAQAAVWQQMLVLYVSAVGPLIGFTISFATAMRRTKCAALHDLATAVRVVTKPSLERAALPQRHELWPTRPGVAPTVGPYILLDGSPSPKGALAAFDGQLARRVWIDTFSTNRPPVTRARRDVARPSRLRWLSGQRTAAGGWDAYEAVDGEALDGTQFHRRSWREVRGWLFDLAREIEQSSKDGTYLAPLPRRIWVHRERAFILEWPETYQQTSIADAQSQLFAIAARGLGLWRTDGNLRMPPELPLHARTFLCDLLSGRFENVTALTERLHLFEGWPSALTRSRRAAHAALCAALPALTMLIVAGATILVRPAVIRSPDLFVLLECLRSLDQLDRSGRPDAESARVAVEVYLADHYRAILTPNPATQRPWYWPLIDLQRARFDGALRRHPNPTTDDLRQAEEQIGPVIAAARQKQQRMIDEGMPWNFVAFAGFMVMPLGAALGILSAAFVRGGIAMKWIGLAVIDESGEEVSRPRSLARATLGWAPLILLPVLVLLVQRGLWAGVASALPLALMALLATGLLMGLVDPARGLHDRLIKTRVVAL